MIPSFFAEAATINGLGWVFMIVSVGFVLILTTWCFKRVLTDPEDEAAPPAGYGP